MAKPPRQAIGADHPRPLSGLDILMLEDEPLVALDIEELLLQNGARTVEITASVATAREIVTSRPFSAIVLDVKLSDGSGLELLPLLRSLQIPAVIATGYSGLEVDGLPVIQKPYSGTHLVNVIAAIALRVPR
jgi:DNA-binding response OmpR family regulator